MENVKNFLEADHAELQKNNKDYTEYVQVEASLVIARCASDMQFPGEALGNKDWSHEAFPYFANCVRNNVFMDVTLNSNATVKTLLGGAYY